MSNESASDAVDRREFLRLAAGSMAIPLSASDSAAMPESRAATMLAAAA